MRAECERLLVPALAGKPPVAPGAAQNPSIAVDRYGRFIIGFEVPGLHDPSELPTFDVIVQRFVSDGEGQGGASGEESSPSMAERYAALVKALKAYDFESMTTWQRMAAMKSEMIAAGILPP